MMNNTGTSPWRQLTATRHRKHKLSMEMSEDAQAL